MTLKQLSKDFKHAKNNSALFLKELDYLDSSIAKHSKTVKPLLNSLPRPKNVKETTFVSILAKNLMNTTKKDSNE